ncbi:hypothetical protein TRVA0_001S09010 [Trichomonascus vanleenenianus]
MSEHTCCCKVCTCKKCECTKDECKCKSCPSCGTKSDHTQTQTST